MKLLFDQNLSHRLTGQLAAEFPGSAHVRDLGMAAAPDPALWAYAAANGFVIASKDTDFQQRALLSDAQRQELQRRAAEDDASPDEVAPWEVVKANILARLGSR